MLLASAAIMFVALLSLYVHLLHQSVAGGEALRLEQRLGTAANKAESAVRPRMARATVVQSLAVPSGR